MNNTIKITMSFETEVSKEQKNSDVFMKKNIDRLMKSIRKNLTYRNIAVVQVESEQHIAEHLPSGIKYIVIHSFNIYVVDNPSLKTLITK